MNLIEIFVQGLYFSSALLILVWVFFKRCDRHKFVYRAAFAGLIFATSVIVFSALKPDPLGSPFDTWKRVIYIGALMFYFAVDTGRIVLERYGRAKRLEFINRAKARFH